MGALDGAGRNQGVPAEVIPALSPDAVIAPRGRGPRIFLELDRSTEPITERRGRRSIVRKLKTYRTVFVLPQPGEDRPPYAALFGDNRPARLAFVLARDTRGQRRKSILAAANDVAPELEISCIPLADVTALRDLVAPHRPPVAQADRKVVDGNNHPRIADRAVVGEAVPRAQRAQAGGLADDRMDILRVAKCFYRTVVNELRCAGVSARSFPELAELQREVRQRLEKPPRNPSRLIGGLYRRFFRASLEILERRRPRDQWSSDLLKAEQEIRPLLFELHQQKRKEVERCA